MHNQHRSPDPTKIERATATSTVALFFYYYIYIFFLQGLDNLGLTTNDPGEMRFLQALDDLGLTTNDPGEMQTMLNKLRKYAEKKGLAVNTANQVGGGSF